MSSNQLAADIRTILPGQDCAGRGGCGFPTCAQCAAAIADGAPANRCPACSQEEVDAILALTGGEVKPLTLYLKNTTAEERELLLTGCLMNHYAAQNKA